MGKWLKGLVIGLGMITFTTPAYAFFGLGQDTDPDCFVNCLQAEQQDSCRIGSVFICKRACKIAPEPVNTYNGQVIQERIETVIDPNGNEVPTVLTSSYIASELCAFDLGLQDDPTQPPTDGGQLYFDDNQGPVILCGAQIIDTSSACVQGAGDSPNTAVVSAINFSGILDEIAATGDVPDNIFPIEPLTVPTPDGQTTPYGSYPKCTSSKHQPMPSFFGGGFGLGCRETPTIEWLIQGCGAYMGCCPDAGGCFVQNIPADGDYNRVDPL